MRINSICQKFKNLIKRSIWVVAIISLSMITVAENKDNDENVVDRIKNMKQTVDYKLTDGIDEFDTVKFGRYSQEKDQYGIYNKELVEWILVYRDDVNAVLMSKYILDCKMFNEEPTITRIDELVHGKSTNKYSCDWKYSTLRKWMNDYMYNELFNDEEKKLINTTYLDNTYVADYEHHTVRGNNTEDKLFLLNENEMFHFFGKVYKDDKNDNNEKNRIKATRGTSYAINNKNLLTSDGNSNYFLRPNGDMNEYVPTITFDGSFKWKNHVNGEKNGIRPCICIKLKETNDMARINISKELRHDEKEVSENVVFYEKVTMGKWTKNDKAYDLKWSILKKDGNKAFIVCDNVIQSVPYYKEKTDVAIWQDSNARKYLNSDFYKLAFNDLERIKILDTNIKVNNNIFTEEKDQTYILDKIFLLSYDEIVEYIGLDNKEILGGMRLGEKTHRTWWTRTIGEKKNTLITIGSLGRIYKTTNATSTGYLRPAMWVRIN